MRQGHRGWLVQYKGHKGGACVCVLCTLFVLVTMAIPTGAAPAQPVAAEPNTCVGCHATLQDTRLSTPVTLSSRQDVHRDKGFLCIDCHGGNPTVADRTRAHDASGRESAMAFRGKPAGEAVIATCARCHSD